MDRFNHICLRATYNEWMNTKIYSVMADECLNGVIDDTDNLIPAVINILNHLMVADILWLKRFAIHPANYSALAPILSLPTPARLDQILFTDILHLAERRQFLDKIICEWAHSIVRLDLDHQLCYKNMKGMITNQKFFSLIMHFFNYQTYHRGQIITLLSQADIEIGATELFVPTPDGIDI